MIDDAQIASLHASPWFGSFAVTGGGSRTLSRLLEVPGASATVAEGVIPYADLALQQYLNGKPDQACSEPAVRAMAMAAYQRTKALAAPTQTQQFGFAITASLRSINPKRGAHRVHIGVQTTQRTQTYSLELTKGRRSRAEEETLASELGLYGLLKGLGFLVPVPQFDSAERIRNRIFEAPREWQQLIAGEIDKVAARPNIGPRSDRSLIFSGSFNPMHAGHREMARIAQARTGLALTYEICVRNADKPPLDYLSISERLSELPADHSCWLTRAGNFSAKAQLFPNSTFVLGIDTLVRIADPRFYGSREVMETALASMATYGARFLVFGRVSGTTFLSITNTNLPPLLADLCEQVPEAEFRADISSSAIRASRAESDES